MLKKVLFIIPLLVLTLLPASAQYEVSLSHYFDMEPSFNPAAAGKEAKLNVNAAYALDLAGYEHHPRTMYLGGDMPLYFMKAYHGAGVQLMNDKVGLFVHQRLALLYAYRQSLLGGKIAAGLQLGLLSEKFDGTRLDAGTPNDPALPTSDVAGSGLDVGLGLYYNRGPWYVGLSAQHLNAPTINLGASHELKIDATYYLTGGYNIKLRNPFLTIRPSFLVRTDLVAWRADLTGRMVYNHDGRILYGGVAYSPTNSVTFLVGGSFHGIVIGYSYELYTSAITPGNGSHGLFIGYQTDINLVKKGKNKHKSVRIL